MLNRASYQNFRKSSFEGSLETDPASDIGLDRCITRCMTLHHSSRPFILHIRAFPAGNCHILIFICKSTAKSISAPYSSLECILLSWIYINNNMAMIFEFLVQIIDRIRVNDFNNGLE